MCDTCCCRSWLTNEIEESLPAVFLIVGASLHNSISTCDIFARRRVKLCAENKIRLRLSTAGGQPETTAIHFSSIAIGVGNATTSTVVRQGWFATKYSL